LSETAILKYAIQVLDFLVSFCGVLKQELKFCYRKHRLKVKVISSAENQLILWKIHLIPSNLRY